MWKKIINHKNYKINNKGIVLKIKSLKVITPFITTNGYLRIRFDKKAYQVHRLIAIHFIDNPNNYSEINHIDSNKLNNKIENLEWCTRNQNMIHSVAAGTAAILSIKRKKGEEIKSSKLTQLQVNEIKILFKSKHNKTAISKLYNVSRQTIRDIYLNKTWKT